MKREIHDKLISMLKDQSRTEVIIIEGARQVGKSYLVNSVLSDLKIPSKSFDLEKNTSFKRALDQTEDFDDLKALLIDRYQIEQNSILFIDEAQECSKLSKYIKSFKEDWPEIKVILTGSSMNKFYKKNQRIPVGRSRSLCVYPFTFIEFLKYKPFDELINVIKSAPQKIPLSRHETLLGLYDEYLNVGGYPEAVKSYWNGQVPFEIIDEIIASLAEDFERKEEYQPRLFNDVIRVVSNHIGAITKYSQIDTTKYQSKKVIEAMKAWHIIFEVEIYSHSSHQSKFSPKRYLHDVGVVNRFRSLAAPKISMINTIDPALRTSLGGLFENAVLINLLEAESAFKTISTWKKGNNADIEVDFIFDYFEKGVKIPIECKATTRLYNRHFKNIIQYLNLTKQHFGILVSAAPFEAKTLDRHMTIINIPVYLLTKENIKQYYNDFINHFIAPANKYVSKRG